MLGARTSPVRPVSVLALLLTAPAALAQSERLLEAIRLERPAMRAIAESELVACAAKDCPERDSLNLLSAVLALNEGDSARAATLLRAQKGPAGLEPYRAYYLGRALLAKEPSAALEQFKLAQRGPPVLAAKARVGLAEALAGAGSYAEVNALLKGALDSAPLLRVRARARAALDDTPGEVADLRELVLRFPLSPEAPEAQTRLLAVSPKPFSLDERLARGQLFRQRQDGKALLAEAARIDVEKLATTPAEKAKVAALRASASFELNDPTTGYAQLALAAKGDRDTVLDAKLIGATRAMYEDNAKARIQMLAIAQEFAGEPRADMAAFYAAWLAFYSDEFEVAATELNGFVKRYPKSAHADEARWYRALALLHLERYAEAKSALAPAAAGDEPELAAQARYWSARSDHLAGTAVDKVANAYAGVITAFPGSYYAVLSAERLRELGRKAPQPLPTPATRDAPIPPELKLARALAAAGLYVDSGELVEARIGHVKANADALSLGHALLGFGEFGAAFRLAHRVLGDDKASLRSPQALALLYPRAFRSHVEREAKSHGLPASLVWSTMRRESQFRAEFRSEANALGLMQVLPRTAAKVAQARGEPKPEPGDLFSSAINIRMGSWYLGALQKRFRHPVLVAAAYNAGPARVAQWLSDFGKLPADLWVEVVPFRETRSYLRQVIADSATYQVLYNGKADPLSFTLPAPRDGVDF